MNSGGFDISSLTRNSPGGGATPPSFGVGPGSIVGGSNLLLPPSVNAGQLGSFGAGIAGNGPVGGALGHQGTSSAAAMASATNSLASSLNLSSIHPLANLLVELPLPSETVALAKTQNSLVSDHQLQHHLASNLHQEPGHQHQLSLQLVQQLHVSQQQLSTLNVSWNPNVLPGQNFNANQPPQFSQNHIQNSYLLSLLHKSNAFGTHVVLPPVSHQIAPPPPPPPQQQPRTPQQQAVTVQHQQSSQYRPWSEQGQQAQQPQSQQQQQVPGSPFVASPAPAVPNQQTYPRQSNSFNHANPMYSLNDNSNSNSSSFSSEVAPIPGTPTTDALGASPLASHNNSNQTQGYHHQQAAQQHRYEQQQQSSKTRTSHHQPHASPSPLNHQQSPAHLAPHTPQPQHNQQPLTPQHNQAPVQHHRELEPSSPLPPQPLYHEQLPQHHQANHNQEQQQELDLKALQNSLTNEPVIMLDKLDMSEYYEDNFSSLGDRVKSNKRQRLSESSPVDKKKKKRDKRENSRDEPTPNKKQQNSSVDKSDRHVPPPKKSNTSATNSKNSTPVKLSSVSSFSTSYTSSHSMSTSSAPQLASQNSSLPAFDKLQAMLDEMFDLGKVKNDKAKKRNESSDEDDSEEDSDSERRRKKNKKSNKVNGDSGSKDQSAVQLFDTTISGSTLAHFVALTAKLKRNNQMQTMPVSKVINLMNVLTQQLAVQSSYLKDKRRKSTEENDEDQDDEMNITNSASMMQKFESCCDCSCIALYIMSSKAMSSRIYLEECIEQIIAFLNTTIQQYTTIGAAAFSSPSKQSKKSPKKATNSYISPTSGANKKILGKMYTKWSELIGLLVEMLNHRQGSLTDTLVLSSTRLALGAFFLENLTSGNSNSVLSASNSNEIQLNALKLTTTIFSQYQGHRAVILEELLQSIARLPTSKRGRVCYKVEGDEGSVGSSISMFSALLQQLIQSLFTEKDKSKKEGKDKSDEKPGKDDKAASARKTIANTLKQQYDSALRVAYSFLNSFIRKCFGLCVGGAQPTSSDCDYRVLFEGLVNDLMTTLHKPNWPAAQLLTQVLIKILITNITTNTKPAKGAGGSGGGGGNAQLNLKLASLDHLGTIVSRFSKELSDVEKIKSDVKSSLNRILNGDKQGTKDDEKAVDSSEEVPESKKKKTKRKRKGSKDIRNDELESVVVMEKEIWKHLIRYCDEEKLVEEKNLFVSMWIKEKEREAEFAQQQQQNEATVDGNGVVGLSPLDQYEQKIKQFMTLYKNAANPNFEDEEYHVIDSKTAESIVRFLDISQNTTVKLFDSALGHVVAALSATLNTTMRSRAMKSLSTILNNAHKKNAFELLSRNDLQQAIKTALLDPSTSVREATIDLIGKFILSGESDALIDQYYDIFTDRLRDTGVSVRKRVIKILREICLHYPTYKRVPEICSKIIKRINDDGEGIRKLVTETFTSMWFKEEKSKEAAKLKVTCINHVMSTIIAERIGTEWLQQLLVNLFSVDSDKKKVTDEDDEDKPSVTAQQLQQVTAASAQIIDVLIADILCCDQNSPDQNNKTACLSAMTTIWMFAKVCPQLVMNHISTLHPYLSQKCLTQGDLMIMIKVVEILELVLPKLSNPSPAMLVRIEEDLTKNIIQSSVHVLPCCVSCLSTLIHKHTNNQNLIQELFPKLFKMLVGVAQNPSCLAQIRPRFLRALFTCGLFAKHFEFLSNKQQLYEIFVKFIIDNQATPDSPESKDADILSKALNALGFLFERNPEFSLKAQSQDIYKNMLRHSDRYSQSYHDTTTCQVLRNLTNYLSDEFNTEREKNIEWSKEDLKSMTSEEGDSGSLQSRVIQCYLADILRCTLSPLLVVRRTAVNLIHIIHNGGHVHPLQLVPYLIAMSSDDDASIRLRADHVLHEIERKYHGFVAMKSKAGVHLSYQLHQHQGRRGYRIESVTQSSTPANSSGSTSVSNSLGADDKLITGRLSTLYTVVAANRSSRRAFISGFLKYFDMIGSGGAPTNSMMNDVMLANTMSMDDYDNPGPIQNFVCDNIAWLPYSFWDEPLYILQQLELNISLLASHIQSLFKDVLNIQGDEEEEQLQKEEAEDQEARIKTSNNEHSDNNDGTNNSEAISESREGDPAALNPDLRSYLPKPMPSILGTAELIKTLNAFYMLAWTRHLLRELFNITDQKLQDYSPNENQKVWDKPVHRRNVDIRILDRLMVYPNVNIDLENVDESLRKRLLEEYQRFNNHQLTGVDANSKTVIQILKEPPPKEGKASNSFANKNNSKHYNDDSSEAHQSSMMDTLPPLSREAEEELIMKIRASECSVVMTDISSMDITALMKQTSSADYHKPAEEEEVQQPAVHATPQPQSLKMTISVNNSLTSGSTKRKKNKKEKKRKKKKKHRQRIESSDEESNESESNEDSDDPSYS